MAIAPPLTLTIWGCARGSRIEANANAANASRRSPPRRAGPGDALAIQRLLIALRAAQQ